MAEKQDVGQETHSLRLLLVMTCIAANDTLDPQLACSTPKTLST